VVALLVIGALASSCGISGSGFNGKPADVFSIIPTQADVRTLMGDNTWWEGAPTFGVQPLNAETAPATEKFSVSQLYRHIGTDEFLLAHYRIFDKTSSATSYMNDLATSIGSPPTSPKVGDQVIYTGNFGSGGAPYVYATAVRVGQIVLILTWSRKDRGTTVQMLAKTAKGFADPLRNLGKVRSKLRAADPQLLPPAGVGITLLGSAQLPVESFAVLTLTSLPEEIVALLRQAGISTISYGDYALNNDTSMEVQTALLPFPSEADATSWADTFAPAKPDDNGIAFDYLPTGGTPAAGVYHFVFSSGRYGGFMICQAAVQGRAATRDCEDPVRTVALAWKLSLQGLR
jgi:hypothetical protein